MIPYSVRSRTERGTIKVAFEVQVDVVDGRLPNQQELAAISSELHSKEGPHERTFVTFLLPGMKSGAGAFATAHHNPTLAVEILDYMVPEQYQHLLKKPESTAPAAAVAPGLATSATISLAAKVLSATQVELTITTSLPLPVEMAANIELGGQRPDDVWIGHDQRVVVSATPTVVVLDTSKARKPLPAGDYVATVFFNSRYAKNPEAQRFVGELRAAAPVGSFGAGESAAIVAERNELQKWVMLNVITGTKWDEAALTARLGSYTTLQSELSGHDAMHFAKVDMTMLVNTRTQEVTVWRMGKAVK